MSRRSHNRTDRLAAKIESQRVEIVTEEPSSARVSVMGQLLGEDPMEDYGMNGICTACFSPVEFCKCFGG